MTVAFALALAAVAAIASTASAAGVSYIDGYNVWLSSPDGASKFQLTSGGTQDAPWRWPAQGADGKVVAAHPETLDNHTSQALYLYGPDGKQLNVNVLPVDAGATIPVYPLNLDMDASSQDVAYGYSYCSFLCSSVYRGYWLTFSDHQSLYPTNPQGQANALNPTFYGHRIISSDTAGHLFIQPDVAEAPFTNSYTGWLAVDPAEITRAAVAQTGRLVALEWSTYDGSGHPTASGIKIGQHQGTIPSDVTNLCDLPVAATPSTASFSPDGTMITWSDAEGVKVAGVPDLAAGTTTCTLTSPVKLISATGSEPDFGGTDVAKLLPPAQGGGSSTTPPATPPAPPTTTGGGGTTLTVTVGASATRAAFRKGLLVHVKAPAAGRVVLTGTVPSSIGRRLSLRAAHTTLRATGGIAAAKTVVVARGSKTVKAPGTVAVRLVPTAAARRRASKLKGATLTVTIVEGAATATKRVRLS